MRKKFTYLLAAVVAVWAMAVLGEEAKNEPLGTLMLSERTYPLKYVLAYETTSESEGAVAVVFTGQRISGDGLKTARASEKEGGDGDFRPPFLKLVFAKSGELERVAARGGSTTISRGPGNATGELKVQDGRAVGKAAQAVDPEAMFPSSFDVRFDTALLKEGDSLPESTVRKGGPAANVKPTVTGTFKGNGKDAKLAYVSARWMEPFADKPSIMLVFTEKDHSKSKKPDFDATFGKFGSALMVSLHEDGSIFGCEVAHSAHKKQGFSSIGRIEASEFEYGDGKVEGTLSTNGQVETFGETWEVNLKFVAPLGEIPKEFQVAAPKKEEKPATKDADEEEMPAIAGLGGDDDEDAKPAAGAGPKAQDLPLTKDATDVEYKEVVQQLAFKSKGNVKSVASELSAGLKAQGWSGDGPDLVTPQSAILRRKNGAASLTIFVKPEGGGSEVKMMTQGLSWE